MTGKSALVWLVFGPETLIGGNYTEGSDWWNNNNEHPVEQRNAEQLAEGALINEAVRHHCAAGQVRAAAAAQSQPSTPYSTK